MFIYFKDWNKVFNFEIKDWIRIIKVLENI